MIGLFQKNVRVADVGEEELRKARMDLQMMRSTSRQNLVNLEEQKQAAWEKAMREKSKDLRRSYLNEIATAGFKVQLERRTMDTVEGQIRLVSVVEAVKDFQRRQVQSPLLKKLVTLRLGDLDSAVQDMVKQGFYGDQVAGEIIKRWGTGLATETSDEIQELERIIEQAQASSAPGTDVKEMAAQMNQKHNEMLDKRPLAI